MKRFQFDVIVIGCGPAGATAAVTLARAGLSVLVIEAAVYAGAENWSGCVYFAENLAQPDAFGEAAVLAAPYERQLVRRGLYLHNGLDLVGISHQDPKTFRHCYTVLRPVYDPYWAGLVQTHGAMVIPKTTVTSLIRRPGRVIGVETEHGPVYSEVVFLAEGDASHLIRRERLERVTAPRFTQGVKVVLSLSSSDIQERFGLSPGEGSASEYIIRNPQAGGQTARLNIGAFLYTNRDSLSLGYVVPLDNLKDSFQGDHSRLLEWLRGLPHFDSMLSGARLSGYGAKLIRSGGIRDQPVLVEDGLAVGGAACGLGIDIPYPNFTGPASASGLMFARAVRTLLSDGKSITADRLRQAYIEPLRASVYGLNADLLSDWPDYLEKSHSLFGRSVDLICGSAHFLSQKPGSSWNTARFLRGHMTLRALRELFNDGTEMLRASGLRSSLLSAFNPSVMGRWVINLFRLKPGLAPECSISITTAEQHSIDIGRLPQPIRGFLLRISPALSEGMRVIYSNNSVPLADKFREAVRLVFMKFSLADFVLIPAYIAYLGCLSGISLIIDFFRYYLLRQPVESVLRGPVYDYLQSQQVKRDLDHIKIVDSLESKLAVNSYRVGQNSHIHVLWPADLARHGDLIQSSLWTICPARVYQYEPAFVGRGSVRINYENCIKCESCWQASDRDVRWGRHTDHRLIYRADSKAFQSLMEQASVATVPRPPREITHLHPEKKIPIPTLDPHRPVLNELARLVGNALRGIRAYHSAVDSLPPTSDATRRLWPARVGRMVMDRLGCLQEFSASSEAQSAMISCGIHQEALWTWREILRDDCRDLENQLSEGREFHAKAALDRIRNEVLSPIRELFDSIHMDIDDIRSVRNMEGQHTPLRSRVAALFPERIVKEWEDLPIPDDFRERLYSLILEHGLAPEDLIRQLSSISPGLGLLAAHHTAALGILKLNRGALRADLCAVDGEELGIFPATGGLKIRGTLRLVPLGLCRTLLLSHGGKAWILPLNESGVKITPTPGIGFRSAGLHRLDFNDSVMNIHGHVLQALVAVSPFSIPGSAAYTAIALGSADYLILRSREHAEGRIQFSQQMRDTQGRDGIAKLGAVKAMLARIESWRLLLSILLEDASDTRMLQESRLLSDIAATLSAMAFGPDPGQIGYDSGEIFGGMAYSEDDLLARAYRDSALFRYLRPGYGAPERLISRICETSLQDRMDCELGCPGTSEKPEVLQAGPLGDIFRKWLELSKRWEAGFERSDSTRAGQAAALLFGVRRSLSFVQERLEAGLPVEGEAAACGVLSRMAEQALDSMETWGQDSSCPPIAFFPDRPDRARVNLSPRYEEICQQAGAGSAGRSRPVGYQSADYLVKVFDSGPRFVPEIQLHDPMLREGWKSVTDWFIQNVWEKQYDGLHIERYIEKIHGIPKGMLYLFKDRGYFSTLISSELDGGGWWKAEYYIMTTAAGRFGDAGLLLIIMANSSIGTTPVLLGLEKELPLAAEELEPLAQDPRQLGEIGNRLDHLIASLKRPDPVRLNKGFSDLMVRVDSRIRHTRVVKYLAANFLKTFYAAGMAGQRRDLEGFSRGLKEAKILYDSLAPTIQDAVKELPLRRRSHQFFLKKLSHGGVSAFALTEPTAGSDTGGVKTTAHPKSCPLTPLEDGRYRFTLEEGEARPRQDRHLIDADRVELDKETFPSGMGYRISPGKSVPIQSDEYDYDMDEGLRYYVFQNEKRYFHDIAQIRFRNQVPTYDYYELNGAKMWITNGRIATQFCLYAQSPEGVTGFMVDRHSEGLKIGADERKMGQRGSPTNEIAIDQVRVPKECIIGYEGHGQVNALETLNVGRCGLAVAAITLMRKLLIEALEQVPPTPRRDRWLGEVSAILFGSDCITYHLIGLFDQHATQSVRMESAIAKYIASEDLHEVITLIEEAYGPDGLTEEYRVEKIRRDSRVLNIYEGTNEVQRFLILKDLVAVSGKWEPISGREVPGVPGRLAFWKETLRSHVKAAVDLLGDTVWQDAILQPTYFPLADMAGEIFRMDCIAFRVHFLRENRDLLGEDYADPMLALADRSLERCEHRLSGLDRVVRANAELTGKGLYTYETIAADAALERMEKKRPLDPLPAKGLSRPFRILCLLRLVADPAPQPHLRDGRLSEVVWRLNPADEAAVQLAIRMKRISSKPVTVHLLMSGDPGSEPYLRWALGSGADSGYRIDAPVTTGGSSYVEAILKLEKTGTYDLILTGAVSEDGSEPLGAYVAGKTGRFFSRASCLDIVGEGQDLAVRKGSEPGELLILPKQPVVLGWEPNDPPLSVEINALIEGRLGEITEIKVKGEVASEKFLTAQTVSKEAKKITDLPAAVDYLQSYLADVQTIKTPPYESELRDLPIPLRPAVWVVLESQKPRLNFHLLGAGSFLGKSLGLTVYALVIGSESSWPQTIGLARTHGMTGVYCIDTPDGALTDTGRREWLQSVTASIDRGQFVCGKDWDEAVAYLTGRLSERNPILFTGMDGMEGLSLFKMAYGAKLKRSITLSPTVETISFFTVSGGGEFPVTGPVEGFRAGRAVGVGLGIERRWMDLTPLCLDENLSSAEIIIDVGYGVRNQMGFELIEKLKGVLENAGLSVHLGATRKVTQDLKLLPQERQIGQTGIRVNPKLIMAFGISGAPQHMDYIGNRAVILSFNKDPEAPLMKYNESHATPVVHPILGDLFETLPRFIEMLTSVNTNVSTSGG